MGSWPAPPVSSRCTSSTSPTTGASSRRARRPVGGHKGYALAVVTELLAGALSGGPTIQPGNPRRGGTVNNMFAVLIDPARLAGVDWLRREIDGFVEYVKASPPADPVAPVLVPGDPFLQKPFTIDQLLQAVRKTLASRVGAAPAL